MTFGDGSKARITGKGIMSTNNMPEIINVLLIKRQSKLLSISQLSDEKLLVKFNKDLYKVH